MKNKEKYYCYVCGIKEIPEPKMCCGGRECGCMGMPTEPPVCSKECYDILMKPKQATQKSPFSPM